MDFLKIFGVAVALSCSLLFVCFFCCFACVFPFFFFYFLFCLLLLFPCGVSLSLARSFTNEKQSQILWEMHIFFFEYFFACLRVKQKQQHAITNTNTTANAPSHTHTFERSRTLPQLKLVGGNNNKRCCRLLFKHWSILLFSFVLFEKATRQM